MPVSFPQARSVQARTTAAPRVPAIQWMPVMLGLGVICIESTRSMGGAQTGKVLASLWQALLGPWDLSHVGYVNHLLRKAGHFAGYGTLALLFRRAWQSTLRRYSALARVRMVLSVSMLSVACTFAVACLDEWHQSFLPGRTSTFRDVLLDTAGAIVLNAIVWGVASRPRRASASPGTADRIDPVRRIDRHAGRRVADDTERMPRAA